MTYKSYGDMLRCACICCLCMVCVRLCVCGVFGVHYITVPLVLIKEKQSYYD